jgi:hypothetical protein
VSAELRVEAGHPPALSSEKGHVLWDRETAAPWPVSDDVRRVLSSFDGPPVALRERPGGRAGLGTTDVTARA